MSNSAATYTLRNTSRIHPTGAGGRCARGHLWAPEIALQNRPNFRSNSTGKERDEETGYSYFGARYMDHALLTGWLSVDPMSWLYPGYSPYHYCRWNPVRRVDAYGLFDTEKKAQKAQRKAIRKFGKDRVGEITNHGSPQKADYGFSVYGVGKDNKTHAGEDGVWAYRADCYINSKRALRSYSFSQRTIGFSFSLTCGAQCSEAVSVGKRSGFRLNGGSVDLFSHTTQYSKVKQWEHETHSVADPIIHGNRGIGLDSHFIFGAGYDCSYEAAGEYIYEDSKKESKYFAPFYSDELISLGLEVSVIFGVKMQIFSSYAK